MYIKVTIIIMGVRTSEVLDYGFRVPLYLV